MSRALAASTQWAEVLRCAENPGLELIFSNTTEVGIVLDEADVATPPGAAAPRSFPAKLAAFLLHRARWCRFDPARAPVVIPTELIEGNGDKLRDIVMTLAKALERGARVRSAGSTKCASATRWSTASCPARRTKQFAAELRDHPPVRRRHDHDRRAVSAVRHRG